MVVVLLKKVIQQFGLHVTAAHEVEDSHSSFVYKLSLNNGEKVYVKIPYTKIKFERELEAYKILKGNVPIPRMLDCWSGDEECPGVFLLSELKGKPLTSDSSLKVAYEVGVLQASMHSIRPPTWLREIKNEYPNWSYFLERQFYSFAEDVKEILDKTFYSLAIDRFEKMKRLLPSPDGPSFIHMDFRPANIIVDENTVIGTIDFESVRFGSTEIDFTKLYRDYLSVNPNLYEAYENGYNNIRPLIPLENVLPFYRFTDAFNSIGWCKRRGLEKNALFFEKNMTILREFLN